MLKAIISSFRSFTGDVRGAVPIEVVVLSGSVLLLGAAYFETHGTAFPGTEPRVSEEVYVRACGRLRVASSTTHDISRMPSQTCN